ncbi:MAG: uracil-DNA glycosylase [Desulfobacteria bacterium]
MGIKNSFADRVETPVSIDEPIDDFRSYLTYVGGIACNGFALSQKTRDILDEWGKGNAIEETLQGIRNDLGACERCKLHKGRRNIVFGKGNERAGLVFVAEGPGHDEDIKGEPFVGAAGQLLTRIIHAIDLTREDVYICNIVKCRPPRNRNPEPDEIAACMPFLIRQIEAIRPKVICALGTVAARSLLNTDETISRLRGGVYYHEGIRVICTYHPAYLLRNPAKKRDVWEDIQKVQKLVG